MHNWNNNKRQAAAAMPSAGELEQTVERLYEVGEELEKITVELSQKVNELDRQYQLKKQPLYEKRGAIIAKLPEFWLTALLHHSVLSDAISDNDVKLLKHMTKLDVVNMANPNQNGFKIVLTFEPNLIISDTQVWRAFEFRPDGSILATSSGVHFHPNMDYTSKKNAGKQLQSQKREQPDDNFIDSFLLDDATGDYMDLEMFELIKEDIWADPLKYFLDEGPEELDDDDDDDENDEDDQDDAGADE